VTVSTLDTTPHAPARGVVSNAEAPRFFLGTHQPGWLALPGLDGPGSRPVPLFVSDRRLRGYRRLPRAACAWAVDFGAFTELATHGGWDHGAVPAHDVARIRCYRDQIGQMAWAAPQDWMCEPFILTKTGLSVAEHQRRTVDGWTGADYLRCVDRYARAGVDLTAAAVVGVGCICRRQDTAQAGRILAALHEHGITRLHGFGIKLRGLRRHAAMLGSADSMVWSITARGQPPLPDCIGHASCANCPRYAYRWRQHALAAIRRPPTVVQPGLFPLRMAVAA
jgi:hypothetical protein